MKRILLSLLTIGLVSVGAFAATKAIFNDTETSSGNVLSAGTLDLKVDDLDNPNLVHFSVADMKPGDDTGYTVWCLKNTGTVPGQPYVEFSTITNDDNGCNDPEDDTDSTCGSDEGELGQYLKYTIGVGPCHWSVPSLLESQWQTGPVHPWGTPGLNALDGATRFQGPTGYKFPVLNQDETYGFFMKLSLDENVRTWDGTKWVETDDNLIQSDSAEFDITFHLDQVTP